MARKHRPRWTYIPQNSPFLKLPGEIREQIYNAALVRPTPIDLWPLNYAKDPSRTSLTRVPEDLQFVRKEMATGLPATCKQIFHEASNIFWSQNTFRFSGDIEWTGARRFLGQIGPRAVSQLQSLELFAPLADAHCLDASLFEWGRDWQRDRFNINSIESKTRPKMHMVQARQETWTGGFSWLTNCHTSSLVIDRTSFVLTRNVEHVCYLLDMAKTALELKLILPRGFGLSSVHKPPYGENDRHHWIASRHYWRRDEFHDLQLPGDLLRTLPLVTTNATLVIEAGARLEDSGMAKQFAIRGINVACQPGSLVHDDLLSHLTEVLVTRRWIYPSAQFDYLDGISVLFDEIQKCSAPALGGRVTSTPGPNPRNTARILKGFGGCRFVEQDEWKCEGCPHKRGLSGKSLHRRKNTKCTLMKELVIKRKARAIRNGVVNA